MEIGPIELFQYCETIAAEFEERLDRLRNIVDHKLRSGTAYAEILRSFLSEHAAGKYGVHQGFIVNPFIKGASSNHCDILVYDHIQYPLLNGEGELKVVLPRAAAMVIEVERSLTEVRLTQALGNIGSARKVYPYTTGIVFAFDGLAPDALYASMVKHAPTLHNGTAPIAVINMAEGFIAYREKLSTELGGGSSPYNVVQLTTADSSVPLIFLFLLYFDLQMRGMLAAGALNAAWHLLLDGRGTELLGQIEIAN